MELDERYFGEKRKQNTLIPIITSNIKPDSIVYTDTYASYNALDVNDSKLFRINHSKEFAKDSNHINDAPSFWGQAKLIMRKYMELIREISIFS